MKNVIFYHTLTCPQCKAFEMLLKKYNIEHESVVDTEIMKQKGITHTPALEIDGKILQGKEGMDWINSHRG